MYADSAYINRPIRLLKQKAAVKDVGQYELTVTQEWQDSRRQGACRLVQQIPLVIWRVAYVCLALIKRTCGLRMQWTEWT